MKKLEDQAANDNSGEGEARLSITKTQLRQLVRLREQAQELVEAAAQLEREIVTKEAREHLVKTAKPSPELVARVTQRLRAKGVIR